MNKNERKEKKKLISNENKGVIKYVSAELRRDVKIRESTIENYRIILEKLAVFLKNKSIKDATKDDIKAFYDEESAKLKQGTIQVQFAFLKKAYRILFEYTKRGKYPDCIDWLTLSLPEPEKELKENDMWTPEDVERIVKLTRSSRNAAVIKVLAESGCRINEILSLKIGDVTINQKKAYLFISKKRCKTKKARTVELVASVPELRSWLSCHPDRENLEARVFPIKEDAVRRSVKKLADKAKINKPSNLHIFRHSRAMYLFAMGVPLPIINKMQGWKKGSNMFELHYGHFSDKSVSEWTDKINGLTPEENSKPNPIKTSETTCKGCGFQMPLTNVKFCPNCGMAVSLEDEKRVFRMTQKIEFEKIKAMQKLMREAKDQRQEISKLYSAISGLTMRSDIQDAVKEQKGELVACSPADFKRMREELPPQ